MKRVVLMPFTGDPMLLTVWLDFYKRIWKSEVDHLIVLVNTDQMFYPNVEEYVRNLLEENNVQYICSPTRINHGAAIDVMLAALHDSKPDYVGLLEEDAFVFKPQQIEAAFNFLESGQYDIVAGRRGSCSSWLIDLGKELWGTEDHGPNFWPNFFFSSYDTLITTDRDFGAKTWQPGEVVFTDTKMTVERQCGAQLGNSLSPLDSSCLYPSCGCPSTGREHKVPYTSKELTVGDTFVNTSLQLRTKMESDRILLLPQYHCSPNDLYDYDTKHSEYQHVFDGKCPWIHVGSLSSWNSFILAPQIPAKVAVNAEYERRIAFWLLFHNNAIRINPRITDEIPEFSKIYHTALNNLIDRYELSRADITKRIFMYENLMWPST